MLVRLVRMVRLVLQMQVPLAPMLEFVVYLHKAEQDRMVLQVPQALLEHLVKQVLQDRQVKECLDAMALEPVLMVKPVRIVRVLTYVVLMPLVQLVLLVLQVLLERQVRLVKALLDVMEQAQVRMLQVKQDRLVTDRVLMFAA